MKRNTILMITFLQSVLLAGCLSDYNSKPVCRVEDDRIIFKFDLRWNEEKRMEVASRYQLDSALIEAAYLFVPEIKTDSTTWTIKKRSNYFVEFSKPLLNTKLSYLQKNDVFMLDDGWVRREEVSAMPDVIFGYNDLKKESAFSYSDSLARFFLRNHENAEEVFLSGSFNDWSTMEIPLKKVAGGWSATIMLDPGKYTYKYVVDGKWLTDPDNNLKERENNRGLVSVVFCPNKTFILNDTEGRNWQRVRLTGNFIDWKQQGIEMKKNGGIWTLALYFRDGTYAYKFIADNSWMPDPGNPDVRKDADGNLNSFLSIGSSHRFFLPGYTDAQKVVLSGSFNKWSTNELVMKKTGTGWELDYAIPAGTYEYKYLVDGMWMPDLFNAYSVGSGEYLNSVLTIQPTHTFVLENFTDAREVVVTGTFSNWNPSIYRMTRKDGKWVFPIHLAPGKVLYKFVVDGQWMLDPANELWEENEWGTGNSLLWVGK